jgi:hypothetical protein
MTLSFNGNDGWRDAPRKSALFGIRGGSIRKTCRTFMFGAMNTYISSIRQTPPRQQSSSPSSTVLSLPADNMQPRSLIFFTMVTLLSAVSSLPSPGPASDLTPRVKVTLPGGASIDTGDDLSDLGEFSPIEDGFLEGDSDTGGGSDEIGYVHLGRAWFGLWQGLMRVLVRLTARSQTDWGASAP